MGQLSVANDDPERCQGTFGRGMQCHMQREPGNIYCASCAGVSRAAIVPKAVALYRIEKYTTRLHEFEEHPKVQSLGEEVAILRMTLETVLKECGGDDKMVILFSSKILETVNRIKETLVAAHKLQMAMGQLLNKNQVIQLGEQIVAIISAYVTDPQVIENIGVEILKAIDDSGRIAHKID